MATDIEVSGASFQAGVPHALFQTNIEAVAFAFHEYDTAGTGQNFLINSRSKQAAQAITLVVNWPAMLKIR